MQPLLHLLQLAAVRVGHAGYSGWEVQNDEVLELDEQSFDTALSDSKSLWVIEFYAPWCGHCKQLAPEWTDAAKRLATEIPDEVKLAAVDCTVNQALCSEYEVTGYPTIISVENGEPTELPEYRRSAEILTYVRKKLGFPWERADPKIPTDADHAGASAGVSESTSPNKLVELDPWHRDHPGVEKTFNGLPDSVFFKGAFCHNDGASTLDSGHGVTAVIDTVEACIDFCTHRDGAGAAVYHAKG